MEDYEIKDVINRLKVADAEILFSYKLIEAQQNSPQIQKKYTEPVTIKLKIYSKNANRSDVDNYVKPIFDALVEHNVLEDDRLVKSFQITKYKSDNEHILITIRLLK